METKKHNIGGWALLPFVVFIGSFLGIGIYLSMAGDPMGFYAFKAPLAVILGIIVAFIIFRRPIGEKFDTLLKGCSDLNITMMCIIFLLAGAFANVTKQMGAVEATVNFALTFIHPSIIAPGIFVVAIFVALSIGTTMGTLASLGPIVVGVAETLNAPVPFLLACLVTGAMCGGNLAIIGDCTIASSRFMGVTIIDKIKSHILIVAPAAILTFVLLFTFGHIDTNVAQTTYDYSLFLILPYVFVLVLAFSGCNVFVVLTLGSIFAGAVGIFDGKFGMLEYSNHIYDGFLNMIEVLLLSLFTGGLAALVKEAGGIDWILLKIRKVIKGKKSAELGIAAMGLLTDTATANDTVAIVIDGPIARGVAEDYKVDPRRAAALLNSGTQVTQATIPYGAQLLVAAGLTAGQVTALEIIPYLWFQGLVAVSIVVTCLIPAYGNYFANKKPWDFDKWEIKGSSAE